MELNKENQHIVMRNGMMLYFIAADNGILSMLSQKIHHLQKIKLQLTSMTALSAQ
jgi:S-adenosylmethionine hydrolase